MKRKLLVIITLITSLAFTAFVACSNTAQNNSLQHDLKLIVTSDIHAGVDQNLTLPKIVEMRKELEKEGNHTLLIDDGDLAMFTLILKYLFLLLLLDSSLVNNLFLFLDE